MYFELSKPEQHAKLLKACMPFATTENIEKFVGPLVVAMHKYEINNARRQAAFLAQIAHESGSLRYVEEIGSGAAYDVGKKAIGLGNTPEDDGDGERYKGRGLIQITGRHNYAQVGKALHYDFISNPDHLERPGAASLSAAWFWYANHLNRLADIDAFEKISARINGVNKKTGKPNGMEDRLQHWERCRKALNVKL